MFFGNFYKNGYFYWFEKVKYMKLEVMPPKTKNNMNFQPE